MVQWFCIISWKLVDVWTSYFGIMVQYDRTYDLRINVGHCDLYFMVQWFCLISPRLFDGCVFSDNETVWPKLWPQNKYRSTWPIFHGLVILLNILKIIWWMNIVVIIMDLYVLKPVWWRNVVLGIMDQCDTKIDFVKYVGQWPIFHGPLILPYIIVIDLNYFYTVTHGAGRGYSCPSGRLP